MAESLKQSDALEEFLRRKKTEANRSGIDWEAKKQDWLAAVDQLYAFLTEDLLKKLIQDRTVEPPEKIPMEVAEEYVGTYTIAKLVLKVGHEKVEFLPKGVNVIGAAGRVDLRGARDTVTLIREKGNGATSDQWRVVLQRAPNVVTSPLNSDSLNTALQRVML